MELVTIKILDRRAKKLLADLQSRKLIAITDRKENEVALKDLLARLRSKSNLIPSAAEIQREVKVIRRKRYGK